MDPGWLFAIQVAIYAAFPIYFATLRSEMRFALLYLYVGIVLTVAGFLGSVHAYRLFGNVVVSSGSVSYGALMMSTLVLVFVGRDLQVVRNVVRIVIVVNVFKVALYQITSTALRDGRYPNPFGTDPAVFSVSLRVVFVGGALIVTELLILLFVFERLKARVRSRNVLSGLYVACFVVVLCLDGLLFPVGALPRDQMAEAISSGVEAKLVLALAFAAPLVVFLVAFRPSIAAYTATPMRLGDLILAPRDVILRELENEREARRISEAQMATNSSLSLAMASLEPGSSLDEDLASVGRVLHQVPGMEPGPIGMVILLHDDEVMECGSRPAGPTPDATQLMERAASGPWTERRGVDTVAHLPLRTSAGGLAAVIEVTINDDGADALTAALADVAAQATPLLRPALDHARRTWAERSPIVSILEHSSIRAVFQPIVSLTDGTVVSFEGLSRFDPGIAPDERFREAERLGLGVDLQLLAVRTILTEADELPAGLPVAVNVSPHVVLDPRLAETIRDCDRPVKLEVTEHDRVVDYQLLGQAIATMDVRLAIDDAGSGYASLQHILRLEPHEVKLDRSWVTDLDTDRPRQVLVGGLARFVSEIGAELVGEGIEREEEAEILRSLGVRLGQGYYFARPAAAATFTI